MKLSCAWFDLFSETPEVMQMATLHLIVGLPCAGKTTFAKQLELEQHALRFTPDEWHTRLFGQDFTLDLEHLDHNARHDLIETMMWDVAARALQLGTNVILDFGFWGKSEREDYRARASQLGARSVVHFLNVPEEVLLARLEIRNANLPAGTFQIPASKLLEWMKIFQAPTEDELEA
jgi:predicted kinase